MNKALLNKEVQEFLEKNYKKDISGIILKGSPFSEVSPQELAIQLTGKRKAEKKLPTWFKTQGIIYPPTLNLEQTSSEITAEYKASLVEGKTLVDVTGGFGIDSFFFSKRFEQVVHCELNEELSELVGHNSEVLGADNLQTFHGDGIEFIKSSQKNFDWIFIDPSRRDEGGGRVFHLSDCLPDVPAALPLLWQKTDSILLKTSPLLDLQAGIQSLEHVKEIHVVAVDNDVKELVWVLKKGFSGEIKLHSINFKKAEKEVYSGYFGEQPESKYSEPLDYLYEPNAAIMKSGLFDTVGRDHKVLKLHPNTHLYTSKEPRDFPGRKFRILQSLLYKKKVIKKELDLQKANISTRNFPETVEALKKQFKLKDGGEYYLFFTTQKDNQKILLVCQKL
ncbi:class I SAM-dependent methyltransferase [Salinimicrobium soli]|uniref:class I SAM-dependent methyltransferase n=1 Tax=Salinimicrobium soli TaxID=1254399 RepID=UPI003AAFA2B6